MSQQKNKSIQTRPQWDLEKLKQVAADMKRDGRTRLRVDKVKLGVPDLTFLEHFDHLTFLGIYGIKKGLKAIEHLTKLEELCLMKVNALNLNLLKGLDSLKDLGLSYLSASNWDALAELPSLKYFGMSNISKLEDFSFITKLDNAIYIHITDCAGITEIPDLSGMPNLTHFSVSDARNLVEIDGAFKAPNLQKLKLSGVRKIEPEQFRPALEHPSLEHLSWAIEDYVDSPKNIELEKIVGKKFLETKGPHVWIKYT